VVAFPRAALAQATDSQPGTTTSTSPATTTSATTTTTTTTGTTTGATTSQAAAKKDRYLAVTNATIHTVTGPTLADASLLAKNGKIIALGRDLPLPPECEVIDARGLHVYPGLVAVNSVIFGPEPPDDTTDVYSLTMNLALAAGITTAVTGNTASKLTWGSVDGLVLKRNVLFNIRYNTNAPAQRAELRADLAKVQDYLRKQREYELN
jgi:cytosine/adenosine deaminase-related metal-dependent hydrolase